MGDRGQWEAGSTIQATSRGGSHPREDQVNPAQLNRITWCVSTGWTKPYPGDDRVPSPIEVPGRDNPQEIGD
ncbi:hypothetical protein ACFCX0_11240 [Streptomyces sp. NPDC056352]|uniref:hypothetical protein n=1 Tax=Streptomyces sp. NPDC056352 TaxID=3345791 RepID=UPI0035DD9B78